MCTRSDSRSWPLVLSLLLIATAPVPRIAAQSAKEDAESYYLLLRRFDFNERPLGNFDETPMFWDRLSGPGLPRYSAAQFDRTQGAVSGAPSLRFDLRGGSVAYEYVYNDVRVSAGSTYLVRAQVRTEGLEHARAFLATYITDRFGERVSESEYVSALEPAVQSTDPPPNGWRELEIRFTATQPESFFLRIQLWVAQDASWRVTPADEVDPIVREDVRGRAWFDDVAVYRLPVLRLTLSNPGGFIVDGQPESLALVIQDTSKEPKRVDVVIENAQGATVHRERVDVEGGGKHQTRIQVPKLAPGMYVARAQLVVPEQERLIVERMLPFGVVVPFTTTDPAFPDFGVDLGRWVGADPTGAVQLLEALHAGSARVGIPMIGMIHSRDEQIYFDTLRRLVRDLVTAHVDPVGVILPRDRTGRADDDTLLRMVQSNADLAEPMGPIFTFFSGILTTWQFGDELDPLGAVTRWDAESIERLWTELERFVTLPEVVIPRTGEQVGNAARLLGEIFEEVPSGADAPEEHRTRRGDAAVIATIPIQPTTSARGAIWELAFLADQPRHGRRWVRILPYDDRALHPADRIADLAQRVVLAKALDAERVYVPAPFRLHRDGDTKHWVPTENFIVLRTLFHHLSRKRPVRVMHPDPDSVAVLFEGREQDCMVVWSWSANRRLSPTSLYLGDAARALDLNGAPLPLELKDGRARIPLGTAPVIISDLDIPLLLFQESIALSPDRIELQDTEHDLTLRLQNTFRAPMTATVRLKPPKTWNLTPGQIDVQLQDGETLEVPVHLTIPPQEFASEQPIEIRVEIHEPETHSVRLIVPLRIGLRDIDVFVRMRWRGANLIIEHMLENRTEETVNFSSFCQLPARRRQEGAFIRVGPGATYTQIYRFPAATRLIGNMVALGIRETRGPRRLHQVIEIPPSP